MGWNYVSELLPLTDILFIPQLIYEYGERLWNNIDREKPKKSEKNLSQCFFAHNKSHMDWPGRIPGTPRWEAGDWPPETWHGPIFYVRSKGSLRFQLCVQPWSRSPFVSLLKLTTVCGIFLFYRLLVTKLIIYGTRRSSPVHKSPLLVYPSTAQ
jgi:hypothetical protein